MKITYTNQRGVQVHLALCDKHHLYTINNLQAMDYAASVLTGNEFKLYYYMARNQDGYTFALSSKDVCEKIKMSEPTYLKSFNKLVELKFLVQRKNEPEIYDFYDWGNLNIISNGVPTPKDIPPENGFAF